MYVVVVGDLDSLQLIVLYLSKSFNLDKFSQFEVELYSNFFIRLTSITFVSFHNLPYSQCKMDERSSPPGIKTASRFQIYIAEFYCH